MILNKRNKIQEAQVQLDNRDHYHYYLQKVDELITELHDGKHIDDITKKWLSQTPNPPRIPIFYTLTKIHKPLPVGRPIISSCEGPTERISSFLDHLLQPIAQKQKSYLKDTADFINFIEKTQVSQNTILVSMDVTSLYTNIPQDEGITIVWKHTKNTTTTTLQSHPTTFNKSSERPRERKRRLPSPISSWQKSKQKCLIKQNEAEGMETLHRRRFLSMGCQ